MDLTLFRLTSSLPKIVYHYSSCDTFDTFLESPRALLQFRKFQIFIEIKLLREKCAKTKSARITINYAFKYLQNFKKLNLYSRKTENVQILFKCKRSKSNDGSRSKYRFSRVKVK